MSKILGIYDNGKINYTLKDVYKNNFNELTNKQKPKLLIVDLDNGNHIEIELTEDLIKSLQNDLENARQSLVGYKFVKKKESIVDKFKGLFTDFKGHIWSHIIILSILLGIILYNISLLLK